VLALQPDNAVVASNPRHQSDAPPQPPLSLPRSTSPTTTAFGNLGMRIAQFRRETKATEAYTRSIQLAKHD
jgi:hypothetical protein